MAPFWNRNFDVVYIDGSVVSVSPREIFFFMRHPYAVLAYLAIVIVVIIISPHDNAMSISRSEFVLVYTAVYLLSFLNFGLWLVAMGYLAGRYGRGRVYSTMAVFGSTLVNTYFASKAFVLAGGAPIETEELLAQWLMNSTLFELVSTAFARFVVPRIRDAQALVEAAQQLRSQGRVPTQRPPVGQRVPLAGLDCFADEVWRAEAQANYVLVVTATNRQLIRMSLAQFIEKMPEGSGFRVHRSHWVATAYITAYLSVGGRDFVEVGDDTRIPVSPLFRPEAWADSLFVDTK